MNNTSTMTLHRNWLYKEKMCFKLIMVYIYITLSHLCSDCIWFHICSSTHESFAHLQCSPVFIVKYEKYFIFLSFTLEKVDRSGSLVSTLSQWRKFSKREESFYWKCYMKANIGLARLMSRPSPIKMQTENIFIHF